MDKKSRHIAVFSLAFAPFESGAEIAAREIIERLPDLDYSVFTYRFKKEWPKTEQRENILIERVGKGRIGEDYYRGHTLGRFMYIWSAWRRAEKKHHEKPFTVIWAIMAAYSGAAALLFKLRHPNIPLVVTLQEGDSESHILKRVGFFYPLWRLLFKRADQIQVISNYLGDLARRHGATCPVSVIPNGVELKEFEAKIKKKKEKTTPTIITTSRLVEKNGLDTLIKAIAELKKQNVSCELKIIGSGPLESDLKQLAENEGVKNEVRFLGQLPFGEIPDHLREADVFVRLSRSEGLGTSFLEAMAAGLPIVGTKVGGIPDFLKEGKTGLFAEVDNPKSAAEKIKKLLEDKNLRTACIENGKKLIEEKYTWEMISLRMKEIFKKASAPRLLIVTGIFPPDIGGSASYSKTVKEKLEKKGYLVSVMTYGASSQGVHAVSRTWPKGLRHLLFTAKLYLVARKHDILLAADASAGAGFPASLVAKLLHKKYFVRVTGDYAWEQGTQRFGITDSMDLFQSKKYGFWVELLRRLQYRAIEKAGQVIAPSEYLRHIVMGWGIPTSKIRVIYNGIHLPQKGKGKVELQEKLGLHGMHLISAGRLVPWKGFGMLIEVMEEMSEKNKELHLHIIGEGGERETLEKQIKESGLESKITLHGKLDHTTLLEYLTAADVFVLNSGYEGLSHQVLEAMSVSTPVVVSNIGGNPEIVVDEKNGLLFEYNNKEDIIQAIQRLLDNPKEREQLAKNAKESVYKFGEEQMITDLEKMILQ